jgi:hypothetical protein
MIRKLLSRLFAKPTLPVFIDIDPEAAKRESRAATLRAQIEHEAQGLPQDKYVACQKYGENLIAQVNRGEVSFGHAYALIHGFISRRAHTLAPEPSAFIGTRVRS